MVEKNIWASCLTKVAAQTRERQRRTTPKVLASAISATGLIN